jgi:hypothetical protein
LYYIGICIKDAVTLGFKVNPLKVQINTKSIKRIKITHIQTITPPSKQSTEVKKTLNMFTPSNSTIMEMQEED